MRTIAYGATLALFLAALFAFTPAPATAQVYAQYSFPAFNPEVGSGNDMAYNFGYVPHDVGLGSPSIIVTPDRSGPMTTSRSDWAIEAGAGGLAPGTVSPGLSSFRTIW